MLISQVAFEKNKPVWYLLLALACGYATSIRAMGILLLPCISLFFLIDIFMNLSSKEKVLPVVRNLLIFILGFCGMLYLSWPVLWSSPFFYFMESFHGLANIAWSGHVLFNGRIYNGNALPWNYMPVWFSITVPELWLLAGLSGFGWVIISFAKKPVKYLINSSDRNYLLYLACFAVPVIAMIALHGVNIDDWRHLYFIYPSFVMLALFALNKLATGRKKLIVLTLCLLQIGADGFFMVSSHPFQQVYFNNFISHDKEYLRKNYDLEYWGCSFKQGLDYLLAAHQAPVIKINCDEKILLDNNILLLPADQRKRIQFTDMANADYLITNFRAHPYDYPSYDIEYAATVLNSTILSVFRLEKDPAIQKKVNEEEINILKRSQTIYPGDHTIGARIGAAFSRNAQYDSAEVYDQQVLRSDPKNMNAIIDLAGVFFAEEKYPQVFELLIKAIQISPDFVVPYVNIGRCYLRLGNFDSAIYYLGKTLVLDPGNTEAIMQLGVAYSQAQKYDLAEMYFKKAIDQDPNDISALYNLGVTCSKSGKLQEALEQFQKTVAINPAYVRGYSGMAQCYYGMKQYEAVITVINKALVLDPNDVRDIPILALSYKALGKMDMAQKYEAIAQKYDPEFRL